MKLSVYSTVLVTMLAGGGNAMATCTLANGGRAGTVTATFPTENLNPAANVGDVRNFAMSSNQMASAMGLASNSLQIVKCDANEDFMLTDSTYSLLPGNSPGGTGFIDIGIPNLYLYMVFTQGTVTGIRFPSTAGGDYIRPSAGINFGSGRWLDIGNGKLYLYKAGPVSQGGVVPGGLVARWRTSDGVNLVDIMLNSFVVNVKGCEVLNKTPTVYLNEVHVSHFNGVGSNAGSTNFSLGMQCDTNIKPTITFTGTTVSTGTVLLLNDPDATTTAKGVGVEMLYGQKIVNLGEAVSLGTTSTSGTNNYGFTARYVQTESKIKAGEANATANFTINYE
ncbi:TPA: type 1 fimbrial protein [Citrobacter amalonaticus]|uniref:Type 1 fimbrial protein n=1 Tax=Citrobacter amalonaticus TaxID=35703 RepID=A0A9C7QMB7_CITAM|nr:type 1 fimbrial protein [Citrobacter amalonaticus]